VVEKVDVCFGVFTLTVSFRNVVDRFVWAFAGVYGPNSDIDRSLLWDELAGILSWWSLPWCIGGDFSVARFPSERSGEGCRSAMRVFSDFFSEHGLVDFPLAEGAFTWSRSFDPPIWFRIDRFLVSPDWEARFPVSSQKRLPCLYSDHFSILLDCCDISRGSRPFKFENMWLKAEGFVGKVKQWWDSYSFHGTPSFALACKLKALKKDLKIWNEEVFGKVERNRGSCLKNLRLLILLKEVGL